LPPPVGVHQSFLALFGNANRKPRGKELGYNFANRHHSKSIAARNHPKISPHVYHLINMMCHFIVSVSDPVNAVANQAMFPQEHCRKKNRS
jgi:hypothetical protein